MIRRLRIDSEFKFMRSDFKLPEMYSDRCYFHDNVRHFPTWQQPHSVHGNYRQRWNFDEPHRKPAAYFVRLAIVTMKLMCLAQHWLYQRLSRTGQSMGIPMGMAHLKSHSFQYQTLKCPAYWSKCEIGNDNSKMQTSINYQFHPNTQS